MPKREKCSKCQKHAVMANSKICRICSRLEAKERHKKGKWTEEELNELGPTLRSYIKAAIYKREFPND